MSNDIEIAINKLVNTLARHNSIRAMGISGGERVFPKPGEGDIDIFIYCAEIPTKNDKKCLPRCKVIPGSLKLGKCKANIGGWEIVS